MVSHRFVLLQNHAREDRLAVENIEMIARTVASSTSQADYISIVASLAPSACVVPLSWLHDASTAATLRDSSLLQLRRDVERDRFVVNGVHCLGSRGLESVLLTVLHSVQHQARAAFCSAVTDPRAAEGAPDTTVPLKDLFGEKDAIPPRLAAAVVGIVRACNRTVSGGDSYDALMRLLLPTRDDLVIIVPNSAAATPISIQVGLGAYQVKAQASAPAVWRWGARVLLEATTFYDIRDPEDTSRVLYSVDAVYRKRLGLSVQPEDAALDLESCAADGHIELTIKQQSGVESAPAADT